MLDDTTLRNQTLLIGDTSSNGHLSIVIFVFASVNVMNDADLDAIFMICLIFVMNIQDGDDDDTFRKVKTNDQMAMLLIIGQQLQHYHDMTFFLPGSKAVTNKQTAGNQPMVSRWLACQYVFHLLDQSTPEMHPLSLEDSDS